MVYATAGGAVTDIKSSSAGSAFHQQLTEFGWTAGGGIEGAITDNLMAKVEYLYADFGNSACSRRPTAAFAAVNVSSE